MPLFGLMGLVQVRLRAPFSRTTEALHLASRSSQFMDQRLAKQDLGRRAVSGLVCTADDCASGLSNEAKALHSALLPHILSERADPLMERWRFGF